MRLFRRRKPLWDPGASPVATGRRDQPDLPGRRAFLDAHVLIHTHVPKAGGSTLSHGLAGIVGAVNTMDVRLNRRVPLEALKDEDLKGLSLLSGHFPYGIHDRFDRKVLYIASVREPVARAVSNYRFLLTHEDHPDHPHVVGKPFEEAWEALQRAHAHAADNMQSRQLTGTPKKSSVDEGSLWEQVEQTYFLVVPIDAVTKTIQRLRAAFGVPWSRVPPHNISKGNEVDLSPEMRSRILHVNRVDSELYARAREDVDTHLDRACDYIASHCLEPLEDGRT